MAYSILKTNPLVYKIDIDNVGEDLMLLKQNFAFFFSVMTALQEYKEDIVEQKKVFKILDNIHLTELEESDSLIMSIYKDMYFAEVCSNYNILSMTNVFWLLFEFVFGLKEKDVFFSKTKDRDNQHEKKSQSDCYL